LRLSPQRRTSSNREGGDLMTGVTLNANDAAGLAEMLQFLAAEGDDPGGVDRPEHFDAAGRCQDSWTDGFCSS
jgi:hypothetical protein